MTKRRKNSNWVKPACRKPLFLPFFIDAIQERNQDLRLLFVAGHLAEATSFCIPANFMVPVFYKNRVCY
jgi:hypothetical protein